MVGGDDVNEEEEEEKSDIPYGEEGKRSTAPFFCSCDQTVVLIVLFVVAGHFPCKAISKIVQLPTKEGYV